MRCMACFMIPTLALAAVLGYYLNMTIPDNVEKPWVARTAIGGLRMAVSGAIAYKKLAHKDDAMPIIRQGVGFLHMLIGQADMDETTTVTMETIAGVSVQVHKPSAEGTGRPAVIYLHGASSTIYGSSGICNYIAKENNAVVFNVDWSTPNTNILPEGHKVVLNVIKSAAKWGVNNRKISLAGDSLGATVAAALALKLRDSGAKPPLASQILLYPPTQALDFHTPSRASYKNYPGFSRPPEVMAHLINLYLGRKEEFIDEMVANSHISAASKAKYAKYVDYRRLPKSMIPSDYKPVNGNPPKTPLSPEFERAILNPYNFPLMAANTSNLPPAFILTLDGDIFRDDGVLYWQRLKAAGNQATHVDENRGWHGMISFLSPACISDVAEEILQKISLFLKQRPVA